MESYADDYICEVLAIMEIVDRDGMNPGRKRQISELLDAAAECKSGTLKDSSRGSKESLSRGRLQSS